MKRPCTSNFSHVTKFSCACVTYVYMHLCTYDLKPRPATMSKRKKKTMMFTAKCRKDLVVDFGKRDYADIMDSAIAMTQCGIHLKLFPPFSEQMR